jgi:DNA modification methylase
VARVLALRADARALPLPDASVDLIVTSPPYWALRTYADGGQSMKGQIGSEPTPQAYLANLLDCTREWMRVLKPEGSIFVNLGDKFATRYAAIRGGGRAGLNDDDDRRGRSGQNHTGVGEKSLLGLPWRYALACMDELGLILRRDIVWHKINGLPESAADRCRSSHEYLFHLVKQPRYYSAVDEIREPLAEKSFTHRGGGESWGNERNPDNNWGNAKVRRPDPRGALPGSVWTFPSEPLNLPGYLGIEHYAAFPCALPRKCILGWSPPGICTACGQGRFPVTDKQYVKGQSGVSGFKKDGREPLGRLNGTGMAGKPAMDVQATVIGYACACTPYTDYPERRRPSATPGRMLGRGRQQQDARAELTGSRHHGNDWPDRQPVREYHFDRWTPPPTRPARVLDPFGGTGTTAVTAVAHGRDGISADLGADYSRAARWRTQDSAERAKARGQARPPVAKRVNEDFYGGITGELDALLEESS